MKESIEYMLEEFSQVVSYQFADLVMSYPETLRLMALAVMQNCIAAQLQIAPREAASVPPHGRLGDLDRLEQMFVDIDNAPYSGFDGTEPFYSAEDAAQIIRLAPTVIPASEEG